ncbi:MAG: methyl-accepting chemotaxis protein [Spirochaetales bacterium]|nr:methyl-accepting chemotaxis protein [Spirochaetales bacterium]
MKIKSKLLLFIGGSILILLSATFLTLISLTSNRVKKDLTVQLTNQSQNITQQISALLNTSARSYLKAIGEENEKISLEYTKLYTEGVLTKEEAIAAIIEELKDVKILKSGYVFLTDKDGIILSHPDSTKIGTKASTANWILSLGPNDKIFHNYNYKEQNKISYRFYNRILELNVMSSAQMSEFLASLDMVELGENLNSVKLGESGFPYLITPAGLILTNRDPEKVFLSMRKVEDDAFNLVYEEIYQNMKGYYEIDWTDEKGMVRKQFLNFVEEPNSKLIICTSGFLDEFYGTVDSIKLISLISALIMAGLIFLILLIISNNVSRPIVAFTQSLREISQGNGDLTARIDITSSSEIGTMVTSFNSFLDTLQNIIREIKESASRTISIKNDITIDVDETASALHEITANINSMNGQTSNLNENINNSAQSVNNINDSISELSRSVEEQGTMLQNSTAAITQMISSIDNVARITASKQESARELLNNAGEGAQIIERTQGAVQEVHDQLESIRQMAALISDIAEQTNLLAMNAAIEAAHAGEAGRGFAVVSDEIRKLSETSNRNTTQIENTLQKVEASIIQADELSRQTRESFSRINTEIKDMAGALGEIDMSTNELQVGGKEILQAITTLEVVSEGVNEKTGLIKSESTGINKAMDNVKNVTSQVVNGISEIGQGTKEISLSMEKVENRTHNLQETGDNLDKNVNRFKVD